MFGQLYIEDASSEASSFLAPFLWTSFSGETEKQSFGDPHARGVHVRVCVCVESKEETVRRSEPKCNLSLNHIASPGEKPLFLGLVSELNHGEGPIFQK